MHTHERAARKEVKTMKVLLKMESGRTRSLNRVIGLILAIIFVAVFTLVTDWAIDAEIRHNDLVIENFLKNTKFSITNHSSFYRE